MLPNKTQQCEESSKHVPTKIKEFPRNIIKLSNNCDKPSTVVCFIGKYH